MKTVNFQLDGMNSLELTHLDNDLFEVRLAIEGQITIYYMSYERVKQLGSTFYIETALSEFFDR
ncbi:hypothetical protein I6G82_05535 [Lysinibacillus macroides]|uniref:Uncharacterized protein n=1 Tax=Lysinibacillus macroides TaxID=33935 RepID=A0A0N0CWM9_9BACI|nr:hypothetical protein [Lysinibacillus macroides]KOY83217.1 hypothetical protein ADM90_08035 [Lysinibacillus macroides]QPR69077.1 hypothetical protein I6G82_05535 [Lysinibacillus macroides]